jgi:hypothetical protein
VYSYKDDGTFMHISALQHSSMCTYANGGIGRAAERLTLFFLAERVLNRKEKWDADPPAS